MDSAPSSPTPGERIGQVLAAPLRVLLPHAENSLRQFLSRSSLVLLVTLGILLLPVPAGLTSAGQHAIALFVFTASMLALEPISLPIAALMVPVAAVILGVATIDQALAPFSSPTVFLVLASLFLAEALRKHGLTRRLALMTVIVSGGGIPQLLLGLMIISAFFSMWVENTATAAVLIPVAMTIARQVGDSRQASRLLVMLALGIAYSASLGGMATPMGAASNAVASQLLAGVQPWRFIDWFKYGFPAMLLIFPLTWWLLLRIMKLDLKRIDVAPARQDLAKQGKMTRKEKLVLGTLLAAIFFWVAGSTLEQTFGLPATIFSSTMVALLAVGFLSVSELISWSDIKGVSWGIFFIIGAGLSLGDALVRTGVSEWFAGLIAPVISGPPLLLVLLFLVCLSAVLTNLLNNTTIASVLVPILISVAQADPQFNAVQLVLPVTLATTFGYSLPSASGRMALIAATGLVGRQEMLRKGAVVTVISALVLTVLFFVLTQVGWI